LTNQRIYAYIGDPDPVDTVTAFYSYTLPNGKTSPNVPMGIGDGIFNGPQFFIPYDQSYAKGGTVSVTVHATDSRGAPAKPFIFSFHLDPCLLIKG